MSPSLLSLCAAAVVLLSPAWAVAAPTYAGIDLVALGEDAKPPRHDSSSTGYTLDVPGGIIRVFIAPEELPAQWWVQRMAEIRARRKPTPMELPFPFGADDALSAGDDLVILRFGNLGLMVEASGGALPWVERLHPLLLVDDAGWPTAPALAQGPQGWTIEVPFPVRHLSYVGAAPLPGAELRFAEPPSAVVAWDELGRAVRQSFDAAGQPVPGNPPWAEFTPPPPPAPPPADEPQHD